MKQYKKYIIINKTTNEIRNTNDLREYQFLVKLFLLTIERNNNFIVRYYNNYRMMVIK